MDIVSQPEEAIPVNISLLKVSKRNTFSELTLEQLRLRLFL